jgi:putative two-component system response regulator
MRALVVEDDVKLAALLRRGLVEDGHVVDVVRTGDDALWMAGATDYDAIVLDVMLVGRDGFDVCRRLRRNGVWSPVLMLTARDAVEDRVEGLAAGADDFLSKPVNSQELIARVRSLARLKRYTDDLDSASSIIMMLAVMVESRDGYNRGHCHRMANYATALGRRLGLSGDDLQTLRRGGFLHDIGMLAISDSVLRKKGVLEPEEYELIRSHPVIGDNLCAHLRSLQPVRAIVRHHHERLDGSGYPDALRGDDTPFVAQIMGLVDVYEAVTTERAYQQARSVTEAVETLRDHVRRGWRRHDITECFIDLISSGTLGNVTADVPVSWADPTRQGSAWDEV